MFAYLATNIPVIDWFSAEPLEEILEKIKITMYDCVRRKLQHGKVVCQVVQSSGEV